MSSGSVRAYPAIPTYPSLNFTNLSEEALPNIISTATVAKRTFTIIGCVVGCAALASAIALPFLPLWPALGIITGIALLALAISLTVVLCSDAFLERATFEQLRQRTQYCRQVIDDCHTTCMHYVSNVVAHFPALLEEGETVANLRVNCGNISSVVEGYRELLLAEDWQNVAQQLAQDYTRSLGSEYAQVIHARSGGILTYECIALAAKTPVDTHPLPEFIQQAKQCMGNSFYDRLMRRIQYAHQTRVVKMLRDFPLLKKEEETFEEYLRSSSGDYLSKLARSSRARFQQHYQSLLDLPHVALTQWMGVFVNNTLNELERHYIQNTEHRLAHDFNIDLRQGVMSQITRQVFAAVTHPSMDPAVKALRQLLSRRSDKELDDLCTKWKQNMVWSYGQYIAKMLERFPELRPDGETISAYTIRSANNYQPFDSFVQRCRKNFRQFLQKNHLEALRSAFYTQGIKLLWDNYTAFAGADFGRLYPGELWPILEFLDKQDPA